MVIIRFNTGKTCSFFKRTATDYTSKCQSFLMYSMEDKKSILCMYGYPKVAYCM